MDFRRYTPGWPLSEFVHLFWSCEQYRAPHAKERLLPDGSVELVINLRADISRTYDRDNPERCHTCPGVIVAGPHSNFFVIDTDEQEGCMGIHFRPGGAFPFLGVPADELHDTLVGLDALWGRAAAELRERMLDFATPEERFSELGLILLERLGCSRSPHPAVAFSLRRFEHTPHIRTVGDITREVALSSRRFIQVFREQVGMSPKLYCRVRRFQAAVQAIGTGKAVDWTTVALDCGYYDQAHFIHDFRAFSGLTPTMYLSQHTAHLNHVPLDSVT